MIEADGWYEVKVVYVKHKTKNGLVTIPHPKKDLPNETVKRILKQAHLK